MKKQNKLQQLSKEQLENKALEYKMMIGIFVPIILGLFYFVVRDYLNNEAVNWSTVTIAICSLGGPATLYPELRNIQKELASRA